MRVAFAVIVFVMVIRQHWAFRLKKDLNYLEDSRTLDVDEEKVPEIFHEKGRTYEESGRGWEITSSILQLIYNLIGRTGHSPKSLQLARQMNVSKEKHDSFFK